MSPRTRAVAIVTAVAALAAGATVGATLLTAEEQHDVQRGPATLSPRRGAPPLVLDLGVRTDAEAVALRRAAALYDRRRRAAGDIFGRYDSLEAQVGSAFATWPDGLDRLERLAEEHPESALVQLNLGIGLVWAGRAEEAQGAWRRAKRAEPDTAYAIRAADLLHPDLPVPGVPFFVPSFEPPGELERLAPPRQLAYLRNRASSGGSREKLLYGLALQRLGRQLSAERQYAAAAALAPNDPETQVAAAVGLFDKDRPAVAFSRLGPLARTYPRAATVRFHLGLLLLWLGRVDESKEQLRRARSVAPGSPLAKEAKRFLVRLRNVRTVGPKR